MLNSIQQNFQSEILLIGTVHSGWSQTHPKPQRVIVLVCRLQKSSTGTKILSKGEGHFSLTDQNDKTSQSGPPSKLSPEYSSQTKLKWSVPFDEPTEISGILG